MADIPVYTAPVVDGREVQALYWTNLRRLAEIVQSIAFEPYPDPDAVIHEPIRRQRMLFAERLRFLIHRLIQQFASTGGAPKTTVVPKKATAAEKEEAMLRATEAATATANFTHAPQHDDLQTHALDLAAAAMIFNIGVPSDSLIARQMKTLVAVYLSGPDEIASWQTALAAQFDVASIWMRRKDFTAREIAIAICARMTTVPDVPLAFGAVSPDQLDALETVVGHNLRRDEKAFRLPQKGKHAGGRGKGRTVSSWQIATEFVEVFDDDDLKMPRPHDARRTRKKKKAKKNSAAQRR